MRRLKRRVRRRLLRSLGGALYECLGCGTLYGEPGVCEDCGVALMPAPVCADPHRATPLDRSRRVT